MDRRPPTRHTAASKSLSRGVKCLALASAQATCRAAVGCECEGGVKCPALASAQATCRAAVGCECEGGVKCLRWRAPRPPAGQRLGVNARGE
eukprot:352231-Chlamydomonas_euryale.AAC.1